MSWPMVSPLRQRMIDDIRARKLGRHSLRSHIHSCKRFAAFLKRSPETATADDVRRFQLTLIEEEGLTICNRNRVMTGVKFLLRVTMRRHDLAAEIYHLKEPQTRRGDIAAFRREAEGEVVSHLVPSGVNLDHLPVLAEARSMGLIERAGRR